MTSGEPPKATKKGLFAWLPTAAKETPSIAAQEPPVPKRSEFGFWSRWTYSYSNDLFKRGSKRVLNAAEYPGIEDDDESQKLSKTLMDLWEIESKTPRPALWKCLPKMFGRWYALAGVVYFLEVGGKIGEALVLGGLLSWFESPNAPTRDGLGYAFGLVALAFLRAILHHIGFFVTMRVGMQVRVTFIAAIYRKCMSLSIASTSSSGMIVNMVSNDVQRFEDLAPFLHFLWIAPLEVILVLYFIYLQISWAAFAAVGSLLLFIPLQGFFAKQFGGIRIRAVRYRDERIKTLSDMLSGILLVKLYGWEDPFMKKIVELRNEELKAIRQASLIRATNDAVFFASSAVTSLFAFVTYTLMGESLTPIKVFVTIVLLQSIRLDMMNFFPKAAQWFSESRVSLNRIQTFMQMTGMAEARDAKDDVEILDKESEDPLHPVMVSIDQAFFSWPKATALHRSRSDSLPLPLPEVQEMVPLNPERHVLSDITLQVKKGDLIGVCGIVGAGKSSLLNAILGELQPSAGKVATRTKSMGYASQSAWLMSGTIKENILFGAPFDEEWFKKVVTACALDRDLELFPKKEETFIGERGVTLSGGQRARLALARAVYFNADIYLLDDPLSAVDSKVGSHLFEECIRGLLKDKAIVLVSHQLQHIKNCDKVVLLENGKIQASGSFEDVMQAPGSHFAETMREFVNGEHVEVEEIQDAKDTEKMLDAIEATRPAEVASEHDNKNEEKSHVGTVGLSVYFNYFKAGRSAFLLFLLILVIVLGEFFLIASTYWLSRWSQQDADIQDTNQALNLYIFIGLVLATIAASMVRAAWFYLNALRAGRILFVDMLASVFRSPIDFFHSNPHGRIMNRFSKDMNLVDETLPMTTFDFAQCFFMILGSILITVIVLPYALIILPVLLVIFVYIRMYYIATSRQVKRLESTTRSPVYSSFPSTIEGLALIRAFDAENRFLKSFFETQNENTRVFFSFLSCGRWLGFRLDILAFAFLLIVAPLCVVLRSQLGLSGGVIGLVLSYMLENLGLIQWAVRQSAEVENFMVSAERVMEYSNLPSEAAEVTATRPPAGWPSKGEISINNMTLKYPKGDEPVLKDISFSVKPGEKIGIVGRTGAGKSSLLQALFRIVEPTPQKSIVIDGLATSDLGLKDLRCNLSIIPQESFCFKGSLRFNLDPFKHSSDQEIWRALDAVELKRVVENLPFKLETPVEENGSNWSVGERQLICLARTVLRNSKVVVMDEATSNVDARTDACIQRAIRDDSMGIFANASVLTIAHRLNTVIDYDQILVLDAGRVVEFGPPWALLEKAPTDESAWFSRLVAEMDPEVQNALRRISTTRKKTN